MGFSGLNFKLAFSSSACLDRCSWRQRRTDERFRLNSSIHCPVAWRSGAIICTARRTLTFVRSRDDKTEGVRMTFLSLFFLSNICFQIQCYLPSEIYKHWSFALITSAWSVCHVVYQYATYRSTYANKVRLWAHPKYYLISTKICRIKFCR